MHLQRGCLHNTYTSTLLNVLDPSQGTPTISTLVEEMKRRISSGLYQGHMAFCIIVKK